MCIAGHIRQRWRERVLVAALVAVAPVAALVAVALVAAPVAVALVAALVAVALVAARECSSRRHIRQKHSKASASAATRATGTCQQIRQKRHSGAPKLP